MSILERLSANSRHSFAASAVGALLILALLTTALGGLLEAKALAAAWLSAVWFWLGLSLGCLSLFMIHQTTGGPWGETLKPFLKAGLALLPIMALLSLPLIWAIGPLFSWWPPSEITQETVLAKQAYLNAPFQMIRLLLCLAALVALAIALKGWQAPRRGRTQRAASAGGLLVWALVSTILIIDWVMALEPRFYSTMVGFVAACDQWLAALAFGLLGCCLAAGAPIPVQRLQDLAGLLLAAVMFWAYIQFMQFLIIWSGNLPHEILWYQHRQGPGWTWVAVLRVLSCFVVPFVLLLSPRIRRSRRALGMIAVLVLAGGLIETSWLILPNFPQLSHGRMGPSALPLVMALGPGGIGLVASLWLWPVSAPLVAVLGIGGIWVAGVLELLGRWREPSISHQSVPR